MVTVPSSPAVGIPEVAPVPAALETPCSVVPLAVFCPWDEAAPAPPAPPAPFPAPPKLMLTSSDFNVSIMKKRTTKKVSKTTLVRFAGRSGRASGGASGHEHRDGSIGINWATAVCAAKSAGLVASHLPCSDDGGIGLGAATWGGTVSGSTIGD